MNSFTKLFGSRSAKGTVSRSRRAVSLFAVSVVAAGSVFAGLGPATHTAGAFIPGDYPSSPGVDTPLTVDSVITHTKVDGHEPRGGEKFEYKAESHASYVDEPSTKYKYEMAIGADPKAPFDSAPEVSDFTVDGVPLTAADAHVDPVSGFENAWRLTIDDFGAVVKDNKNAVVKFTKSATVGDNPPPGEVVTASVYAQVVAQPTPGLSIDGQTKFYNDNGGTLGTDWAPNCTGYIENAFTVSGPGVWLQDIHFADAAGKGLVVPDTAPMTAGKGKNTITVEDENGRDITSRLHLDSNDPALYEYRPDDNTAPAQPDASMAAQIKSGAINPKWRGSMNWPYNPSTFSGKSSDPKSVFLPHGAKITVRKGVTFTNCVNALGVAASTDANSDRRLLVNIAVGREFQQVTSDNFDQFPLPGQKPPPAKCRDIGFVSQVGYAGKTGDINTLDRNYPDGAATVTTRASIGSPEANAISAQDPTTMYYWQSAFGLYRIKNYGDSSPTNKPEKVADTPLRGNDVFALAFDKQGRLWVIMEKGKFKKPLYYMNFSKTANGWEPSGQWVPNGYINVGANKFAIYDFVFDGEGNMYYSLGNVQRHNSKDGVYKIDASDISGADGSAGASVGGGSLIYGYDGSAVYASDPLNVTSMAWGRTPANEEGHKPGQSSLYVGTQNGKVFRIDGPWFNGESAVGPAQAVPLSQAIPSLEDFGSCIFPGVVEPTGGEASFKVKKSVQDPKNGLIVPAGKTSPDPVEIGADGHASITYYVTVTNIGNGPGDPGVISDAFHAPQGFTVTGLKIDGEKQDIAPGGQSANFSIKPGNLDPVANPARVFKVVVDVEAENQLNIDWTSASTCNTEDGGAPTGGFFNKVTMKDDKDGDANNDACVPLKPRRNGHLKLVKKILDQYGDEITNDSAYQRFDLVGSGPTMVEGNKVVEKDVIAGTYYLSEQDDTNFHDGNDELYLSHDWSCEGGTMIKGTAPVDVPYNDPLQVQTTATAVQVNPGDNVTCTVKNTRLPKMHVEKTAADPIDGNTHYGKPVAANANGEVTLKYEVTVHNSSIHVGDATDIVDAFGVPAGLVWDGDKKAIVTTKAGSEGTAKVGGKAVAATREFTKQQMANATLADLIERIPGGKSYTFEISVPLKIDNTVDRSTGKTLFETHRTELGSCTEKTFSDDPDAEKFVNSATGVANSVNETNEYFGKGELNQKKEIQNNIACIPVIQPRVAIEKDAADPTDDNVHIGKSVAVDGDGNVDVSYKVKVFIPDNESYDGEVTTGAITDTFTPPAGLVWRDGDKATVTFDNGGGSAEAQGLAAEVSARDLAQGATLATSVTALKKGTPAFFTITIPLKADTTKVNDGGKQVTKFEKNKTSLGECVNDTTTDSNNPVTDQTKGVSNKAALTGEDTQYSESVHEKDNVACVPVTLKPKWNVEKYAQDDTQDGGFTADPGKTGPAVAATTNPDGSVDATVKYRVRVTNTGLIGGEYPEITDHVTLSDGFAVTKILVDGKPVQNPRNGEFTIPAGQGNTGYVGAREGGNGEYPHKDFIVTVTGHAKTLDADKWKKAGTCENAEGQMGAGGFLNKVTIDGDDGTDGNNQACVPIAPDGRPIKVVKTDGSGNALAGAEFTIVPDNGTKPTADGEGAMPMTLTKNSKDDGTQNVFTSDKLVIGKTYWLFETKAPYTQKQNSYELLPEPLRFQLTGEGLVAFDSAKDKTGKTSGELQSGAFVISGNANDGDVITVKDPRKMTLPDSGGNGGPLPLALGGLALIAFAIIYTKKTSGVSVRS